MKTLRKITFNLFLLAPSLAMAQLPFTVKVGSSPNNEDGDSIKTALEKINSNMVYLAQNGGGGAGSNGVTSTQLKNASFAGNFSSLKAGTITNQFNQFPGGSVIQEILDFNGPDSAWIFDFTPGPASGIGVSRFNFNGPLSATSLSASSLTAQSANITNFFTVTNAFTGTSVDFSRSEWSATLSGSLTITGVANVTAGVYNETILHLTASGADRPVSFPASIHPNQGATLVVTNGFQSDFLIWLQPGVKTNVTQVDYP